MKRILSVALACMMLLSVIVTCVSADEVVDDRYKGDPENGYGLVQEVQAYAMATKPTFEYDAKGNPTNVTLLAKGCVDPEVWGEPTVEVKASEANTVFTREPNSVVSFVYDRFFEDDYKVDPETAVYHEDQSWKDLSYKLWLAWDNDNFYVAAEITDPDQYSMKSGGSSIWNGDCLQFRVDPLGPNGIMKFANENYDYKTTCFDWWTYQKPWFNEADVFNIGVGKVDNLKRNQYQIVNMANSEYGTVINDPKLHRGFELNMITCDENEVNPGVTVITMAIPWDEIVATAATAGYITKDQLGSGYAIGMSTTYLNAGKEIWSGEYNSYLDWGSGITGKHHDREAPWFAYNNPGSNAIMLNNKSAIDHETVIDEVRVAKEIEAPEHKDMILFSDLGDADNQIATTSEGNMHYAPKDGLAAALDIAITGIDPTDSTRSLVGWWIGDWYSYYAGYDISTKTFVLAKQAAGNGINRDEIYKRSDKTYEWKITEMDDEGNYSEDKAGEWHRMGLKHLGDHIEIYFDGEKVLEADEAFLGHHIISANDVEADPTLTEGAVGDELAPQSFILNNTAACVMDNYVIASYDYNLADPQFAVAEKIIGSFTFDNDDSNWKGSPMRYVEAQVKRIDYMPYHVADPENDKDPDAYYAPKPEATVPGDHTHTLTHVDAVAATEEADGNIEYWKCEECGKYFSDAEGANEITAESVVVKYGEVPALAGDMNGDGKLNARDVTALMKAIVAKDNSNMAGDMNGDGKLNARDVTALMKAIIEKK